MINKLIPVFIGLPLTILANHTNAQIEPKEIPPFSRFSVGVHLTQLQNDMGVGLHMTSGYFANSKIAGRISANCQWLQSTAQSNSPKWILYNSVRVGLIGVSGVVQNSIRIYGEGGFIFLIPTKEISKRMTTGAYGHVGFEFFLIQKRSSFFLEMGGVGTGAKAEVLMGSPLYSNGLMVETGFRIYPGRVKKYYP